MTDAVEVQLPGSPVTVERYMFSAGTTTNSSGYGQIHVERNVFDPGTLQAADHTLTYPTAPRGPWDVKAMAVMPGSSIIQPQGASRVFIAARAPGKLGHQDLVILALNETLAITWTFRITAGDDLGTPAYLATFGQLGDPGMAVAVGYTDNSYSVGRDYRAIVFSPDDGTVLYKAFYSSGGTNDDTLSGVAFSAGGGLYGTGTAYAGSDGKPKLTTVYWDTGSGAIFPLFVDAPNPSDGRSYAGAAISASGAVGLSTISVTGWVRQTTLESSPRNYFTASYGEGLSSHPRWTDEYTTPTGGRDSTAADVRCVGSSIPDPDGGAHNYTWVTGRSQAAALDDDALTIQYDWTNAGTGSYHLVKGWISRWDGAENPGYQNQGFHLALDSTVQPPVIYVLGGTFVPVSGTQHHDYLYLSYDTAFRDPTIDEFKPTRWRPNDIHDALPADCYYGVTDGESIPSGFSVRSFLDNDLSNFTRYMMRTGTSWGGSTYFDMLTTLEKDSTP